MILATESFYMLSLEGQWAGTKVKEYPYLDIESMRLAEGNTMGQEDKLLIKFYKKDSKAVQKEIMIWSYDPETFFKVLHILQRQLPSQWQNFLESKLEVVKPDNYQFHAYILKVNKFGQQQPRLFVLTTQWMFNTKPAFEKNTGQWVVKEVKWKIPIKSLLKVELKEKSSKFQMFIYSDLKMQNDLLLAAGMQKVKKTERELDFSDMTVCRDFLFHIKRLHHYHNCTGFNNQKPPLAIELKK